MKRLFPVLVAFSIVFFASSAFADEGDWSDKAGGFGAGADRLVDGSHGLSVRMFPQEALGLELALGMRSNSTSTTPDGGDESTSASRSLDLSVLAEYRIAYGARAAFSGFGGIGFSSISEKVSQGSSTESRSYSDSRSRAWNLP